ncbi:hypothetical protein [Natrinema sp. SYSU A 869]|uniref:hypothetical protein n=1 Tax=Natrinema sp. SYSU A 869 TaxID=2871694 RepID=UPI001CA3E787|nr:hypothetical protein [Natrinema sp. SYSU A 869]
MLTPSGGELELYRSLEPIVRVGIQFAATILVMIIVLGLAQNYGTQAVSKSRQSPIISLCVGIPGLLVSSGLTGTGYLIVDTSLGTFFGIPLVIFGAIILPVATAIGFVAIGCTVATRLGDSRLAIGLLVGALLSGIVGLSFPATAVLLGFASALGIGATIRVLSGATGTTRPDDRTVPPANKI